MLKITMQCESYVQDYSAVCMLSKAMHYVQNYSAVCVLNNAMFRTKVQNVNQAKAVVLRKQ